MAPRFDRHGYDKYLDVTEEEWLEQQARDYWNDVAPIEPHSFAEPVIEGEPFEDTWCPGIADYDRFNRPSWGEEE